MVMKLVDALGNEYALPAGFGLAELSPPAFSLAMQQVLGRHGAAVEPGLGALAVREIQIQGKLMDKDLIDAGSLQAARAAAMADYYALIGFLSNARQAGPVRIYRETGIVVDPAAVGYDADLAPLGYYLEGYLTGGTATPSWGSFGNGIIDVTLRLTCTRPSWQGHFNASSVSGTAGVGSTIEVPFSVLGTVPARPQLILYSAAGLTVGTGKKITLTIGSLSIAWNGSITAGHYLVFDCETGAIYNTTAALPAAARAQWSGASADNEITGVAAADLAEWASISWEFATGDHTLVVSSDDSTASLTAKVYFSNEYYG